MKRALGVGGILAALLMAFTPARAVEIDLFEYAVNIGGDVYGPNYLPLADLPLPARVGLSGFKADTGLGTIRVFATGDATGRVPYVGLFVDHEIEEFDTGFFNETGAAVGTPAAAQTWEIDEPGFSKSGSSNADIFDNFVDSPLDEMVFDNDPNVVEEDVSMALAWELSAPRFASKKLRFEFSLSETRPAGFHLVQRDTYTNDELFSSSRFSVIPEPATLALFALGLAGMGFAGGRRYGKGSGGG